MAEIDHSIRNELYEVINATTRYHIKQDPISTPEKIAMWEWGIDQELFDALELIKQASYHLEPYNDRVTFVVPEWGLGIRWYDRQERPFLKLPQTGPHKIKLHKYGSTALREIRGASLFEVLGHGQATKLGEWATTASELGVQCIEAKQTIKAVFDMVKTAGQLRRMVPDLIQYLPDYMQKELANQERKSPFPDPWAEFDKSKVERLLVVLARGHLVKTLADNSVGVYGDDFTWAQKLP